MSGSWSFVSRVVPDVHPGARPEAAAHPLPGDRGHLKLARGHALAALGDHDGHDSALGNGIDVEVMTLAMHQTVAKEPLVS
jgi:hypothetical protein